jgi:hypothetical protein
MNTSVAIQQINSTSYPDTMGLYVGLPRLLGEANPTYLKRLYDYSASVKDNTNVGVLNQLNIKLGLEPFQTISVSTTDSYMILTYSSGLLTITTPDPNTYAYQAVQMAPDTYWTWNQLSEMVAFINTIPAYTAILIGDDGSCRTLAKQTNMFSALSESISVDFNGAYTFAHSGMIPSSLIFNSTVPPYNLREDQIFFNGTVPSNLEASYQYQITPYSMVSCPANIMALTDPNLAVVGIDEYNRPAFQIAEAIQTIQTIDRSYWGE